MTERLAALRRIIAVQDVIRKRADAALAAAERDKSDVELLRRELDAFTATETLRGVFAGLADAQSRRLARRDEAAAAQIEHRRRSSQAAQARHGLIEKVLDRTEQDEKHWAERRLLEQLIEELAGRPVPD